MPQNLPVLDPEESRDRRLTAFSHVLPNYEIRITPLIGQVMKLMIAFMTSLLLMRFLFALLGVSQTTGLISTVVYWTEPLVAPFRSLFGSSAGIASNNFETETLIAATVLALAGTFTIWLLEFLIRHE